MSRQGYLFSYAQIAFNQLRRHENLRAAQAEWAGDCEVLRRQVLAADGVPKAVDMPLGWRAFTREFELEAEELEVRILAVLSSALFLEAYIFDYCARRESATFARRHIDKMDPVAKWVIVPRLVAPPGLDRSDEIFGRLRRLFALRNGLAHHKTKLSEEISRPPEFPSDVEPVNCVQLIWDLLQKLRRVDPRDEFGESVLRHISSWVKYIKKDSRFYPVLWEA